MKIFDQSSPAESFLKTNDNSRIIINQKKASFLEQKNILNNKNTEESELQLTSVNKAKNQEVLNQTEKMELREIYNSLNSFETIMNSSSSYLFPPQKIIKPDQYQFLS